MSSVASRFAVLLGAVASTWIATQVDAQPAQAFPSRAIRFIVPYPPGGSTDFTAREVAQRLAEKWGQQLVVDNRGGAGSTIGHHLAAIAPPDGYTIVLGTSGGLCVAAALGTKLAYDPQRDFAPIGLAVNVPYIFVVHPSIPATSVREFIAYAKKNPGRLNYASSGAGTPNHLGGEMLDMLAGIKTVHVPYKGGAAAMTDLLGGQIQYMLSAFPQALPHVKSGRLRAIGVGHPTRLKFAPELAPVAEVLPEFNNTTWFGLFAPARTPRALIEKMNADLNGALAHPELVRHMFAAGVEPQGSTPQALGELVRSETERWRKVIKSAGLTIESVR